MGWGVVGIDVFDNFFFLDNIDNVFVVILEIGLELNVICWFCVVGIVGYCYVDGISDNSFYKFNVFDGILVNLIFCFGWFGWDRDN